IPGLYYFFFNQQPRNIQFPSMNMLFHSLGNMNIGIFTSILRIIPDTLDKRLSLRINEFCYNSGINDNILIINTNTRIIINSGLTNNILTLTTTQGIQILNILLIQIIKIRTKFYYIS